MLNDTASNPLIFTKNLVSTALNHLTSRGVLQPSNQMTVEELLNPLDEDFNLDGVTDEEIFKAVMNSKAQHENVVANNGDNNIDNDALIEPPPSCHEALQAKIIIEKYIETINEPHAHKFESILVDFACSTRLTDTQKMKVSLLTDYFAHK